MPDEDTSAPLLASDASASGAELIGVDEMLRRYAGEWGTWQLRHFLLTSLAWALTALHTLVVVFADREPADSAGPDRFVSTVAEWGLVGGQRFKVGLAQSSFFAGSMIGAGIFGHLSDGRLGRKGTLTLTSVLNAALGLLTAVSPSFLIYTGLRLLTGLSTGGLGLSAFVLTTEPMGPTKRGPAAMSTFYFFSFGTIALAILSLFTSSWRSLYIVSSIPSLMFVLVILPFISESPRWHLVHGDLSAAMKIMRSIAKRNNKSLPENVFLSLDCADLSGSQDGSKNDQTNVATSSIIDILRSPVTRTRLALSVTTDLLLSIAYYGLTLNVKNLSTSLHISVMLNAIAEMPAYTLTSMFVKKCGRRPMIVTAMWLSAAFCMVAFVVTKEVQTICGMIGIFSVTAGFNLLFIYTAELFPTTVRNVALGCMTQAGQTGAVVAPMVVALGRSWPFLVFGVCCVVGGVLGFILPETIDQPLYETMEGLEKGERKKENDKYILV